MHGLPRLRLQMVGRAGRPQFDTEGVAVIMTQQQVSGNVRNTELAHEPHGLLLMASAQQ